MQALQGKVAVVAGATRGAGRGIACMLGEAGAIVYCTGRSSRGKKTSLREEVSAFNLANRPETIEETAEIVSAYGGTGISLRVDHSQQDQVKDLFARIISLRWL